MSPGTQVAPECFSRIFFRLGSRCKKRIETWMCGASFPKNHATTELAWDVSEKTRLELYMIGN
ncbi:MAG: hypothetical protein Ct9H300mP29_8020 [Candidatus Neomarinimicrobiota bacterium]|nr:MAG: hypothetical protein Ct9H300mP29_8020 [Candidatus Neomarinimicrobiota bacterium]